MCAIFWSHSTKHSSYLRRTASSQGKRKPNSHKQHMLILLSILSVGILKTELRKIHTHHFNFTIIQNNMTVRKDQRTKEVGENTSE